jgi:hypothetical protein
MSKSSTRRGRRVPHDGGNSEGPPAALNMKTHLIIAATLLLAGSALADSYRVHYSIRGSGRDITQPWQSWRLRNSAKPRRLAIRRP